MPARSRLWPDPRVKPPYGAAELNWGHPLTNSLDTFALFYGVSIVDMTQRYRWSMVNGAVPGIGAGGTGTCPVVDVSLGVVNITPGVPVAAASNWSDFLHYSATGFSGGNPGLWRSGGGSGTTFHIVQGSGSNRIWVRLNGSDILMPSSGPAHTIGLQTTGVTCVSSASIAEYINGVQTYTAGHAVATPAFSITPLGIQNSPSEQWNGVYYAFGLWSRALTAGDYAYLHAEPYAMLRPIVRRRYSVPTAPGGLSIPVAMHHYVGMR